MSVSPVLASVTVPVMVCWAWPATRAHRSSRRVNVFFILLLFIIMSIRVFIYCFIPRYNNAKSPDFLQVGYIKSSSLTLAAGSESGR